MLRDQRPGNGIFGRHALAGSLVSLKSCMHAIAFSRDAVLKLVDTENPPLRLFLGAAPLGIATADYESRLATWREWQPVAVAAQGSA